MILPQFDPTSRSAAKQSVLIGRDVSSNHVRCCHLQNEGISISCPYIRRRSHIPISPSCGRERGDELSRIAGSALGRPRRTPLLQAKHWPNAAELSLIVGAPSKTQRRLLESRQIAASQSVRSEGFDGAVCIARVRPDPK